MRVLDILGLARDNLGRARLRTALTATGVAIGTAAVVALIAFGNGAEAIATSNAASFGQITEIRVFPTAPGPRGRDTGRPHALTPAAVRSIRGLPHVVGVYTSLQTPPLRVVDGRHSADLTSLAQLPITQGLTLLAGADTTDAGSEGVLVPASVARSWGQSLTGLVGRRVTLTAGGDVLGGGNGSLVVIGADRHVRARVAGVYDDTNVAGKNGQPLVIVSSALGAAINGGLRGVSGARYLDQKGYDDLTVRTDDARQTANVAARIGALSYAVQDRADLLARVHTIFAILKAGLGAIGGIALLVAAVGIANTMIMTILERTREIGVMKALGAEPGTVRLLFLTETALVGILGGVAGLALAFGSTALGNVIFHRWLASQDPNPPSSPIFVIPPELVLGALALAAVISLIGGALPSRRAVRLQPLDALRYE